MQLQFCLNEARLLFSSRSFILLVRTGAVAAAAAVDAALPCCVAPLSPIVLCSFLNGRTLGTGGQVQNAEHAQETEGGAAFATADRGGGGRVRRTATGQRRSPARPPYFLSRPYSLALLCVFIGRTVCVVCNARKEGSKNECKRQEK